MRNLSPPHYGGSVKMRRIPSDQIAPGYRRTRGTMQKPFRPNAHCVFSLKNFPVPLAAFVNGLVAPIMLVNGPFGAPAASNENDASDQLSTTAFPARRIFNALG